MAKLSILLGLLILLTSSLCCPEDQKQALLQFKASLINATTSSSLNSTLFRIASWNSSSDCCHWDRVNCSSQFDSRNVIALNLDSLADFRRVPIVLTSAILTPLFHIRSLMVLDLAQNQMQGELPGNGFANLSKLVHLDLQLNDFNGSIPSQLFHLRNLQLLNMYSNSFHGILNGEVGSLQNLRVLNLDNNFLSGISLRRLGT